MFGEQTKVDASELRSRASFLRYSMLLQSGKQVIDATDNIQKSVVRNCGMWDRKGEKTHCHLMLHGSNLRPPYPARPLKQANGGTAPDLSMRPQYASRKSPVYG